MNTKETEQQLRRIVADRSHDPAVDPLEKQAVALEAQIRAADDRVAAARQAVSDAALAAERAYVKGERVDSAARRRLRDQVNEAEEEAMAVANAFAEVKRQMAVTSRARAERDTATLTPIFTALVAEYDQRATALLEIEDLVVLAHTIASHVLPGNSSQLQSGFGGLLNPEKVERWRQRCEVAGLLPKPRTQKVA